MQITLNNVIIESVERYTTKSGEVGANVVVSSLNMETKTRSFLNFSCKDPVQIAEFQTMLQDRCVIVLDLVQNSFGLRLGEVLAMKKNQSATPLNVKTGSSKFE